MRSRAIYPFLIFLAVFAAIFSGVFAGQTAFRIGIPEKITPGTEFEANILVDSDVPLNAFDILLRYPKDILEATRVDNGRSLITIWQNQPQVSEPGELRLTGGSVQAFQGNGGELLTVRFKALREGKASISFASAEAYIADGKGTKAETTAPNLALSVVAGSPLALLPGTKDNTPPKIDLLALEKDPFNPEQKLLTFLVNDKDSGIKETSARYKTFLSWSEWQPVQNPTALPENAWAVEFEARDNVGNPVASIIYYWPVLFWNFLPTFAIVLVLLGAGFLFFRRKRPENI